MSLFKAPDFQLESFHIYDFTLRVFGDTTVVTGRKEWRNARFSDLDVSGQRRFTHVYVRGHQAGASHVTRPVQ